MRRLMLAVVVGAVGALGAASGQAAASNDSIGIYHPVATPASVAGGWQLINRLAYGTTTDYQMTFGEPGDLPIAGDWNGDGRDSVGVYRPNGTSSSWYLTNDSHLSGGPPWAHITITNFGHAGDRPFAGDFNGDGKDDIGIYRPESGGNRSDWYIHLTPATPATSENAPLAEIVITDFGEPGDQPVVGDWDGDGKATIGVYRWTGTTAEWYFANDLTTRQNRPDADASIKNYGAAGDHAVAGDWDGNGRDGVGLYRASPKASWYLTQSVSGHVTAPSAHIVFDWWGLSADLPVAGDWDGKKPECRDNADNDLDEVVDWKPVGRDDGCPSEYDHPEVGPQGTALVWDADAEEPASTEWASACVENGSGTEAEPGDGVRLRSPAWMGTDRFAQQSVPVAQGLKSYRLTVTDSDHCGNPEEDRAELGQANPGRWQSEWPGVDIEKWLFKRGEERWISWQVFLPDAFPTSTSAPATTDDWQTILQWKQLGGLGTPALSMQARDGQFRLYRSTTNHAVPVAAEEIRPDIDIPVKKGRWVKFTLHVRFSPYDNEGFVALYGDTTTQNQMSLLIPSKPTWTMKLDGTTVVPSHARIGIYRDGPTYIGAATAHYDGYSVANNRAAAEYNAFRR